MTKRFRVEKQTFDGYCIVDNHFDGYYAYEKQDLEKLCEKLNNLSEENEELRTKNNAYLQDIEVYNEDNTHLKLENELLQEELQQCKAVINKEWSEYLKKKELQIND